MCGIVGAVALNGSASLDIDAAISQLEHRGPDDVGRWTDGRCSLGFRRLAIIDLSRGGHQPRASACGRYHLVFNGEIYNYRELRTELQAHGRTFASASDSEVLLAAFEQWGEGCLPRLNGMFAFAVWDVQERELFVARDRVGKKPLYYCTAAGRFLFASELQALLTDPAVTREPDLAGLDQYLRWGYVPPPATGFSHVSKLPPGHWLRVRPGRTPVTAIREWWRLDYEPKLDVDEADACDALREQVTDAVRLRMISDVPLGAFLSGGIDSSIVVGLMAGMSGSPVKTYSIGFSEAAYNELPHARRVAERFGTDHHEVVVKPDAASLLPMLVRHFGEPFADSSAIPTYYVSQVARRGVTVALNGDGGDESFAGYERYVGALLADRIARVPGSAATMRAISSILPSGTGQKSRIRTAARFLAVAGQPLPSRYRRWQGYFDDDARSRLYGDAMRPYVDAIRPDWFDRLFDDIEGLSAVDQAMSVDVRSYLPSDLLVKVDITSMACSLEARSPLLDHRVMELAARLPVAYKLRGRRTKHLLLKAFEDLLPPENVNRRKMGFGVPVGEWFRGPMTGLLRDALLGEEARSRGIARPSEVERLVDDHLARRGDHTPLLWSLLVLELWFRELVDGHRPSTSDDHACSA